SLLSCREVFKLEFRFDVVGFPPFFEFFRPILKSKTLDERFEDGFSEIAVIPDATGEWVGGWRRGSFSWPGRISSRASSRSSTEYPIIRLTTSLASRSSVRKGAVTDPPLPLLPPLPDPVKFPW